MLNVLFPSRFDIRPLQKVFDEATTVVDQSGFRDGTGARLTEQREEYKTNGNGL